MYKVNVYLLVEFVRFLRRPLLPIWEFKYSGDCVFFFLLGNHTKRKGISWYLFNLFKACQNDMVSFLYSYDATVFV